ncbi:MarR family transcriptional regulator [Streptomyces sp. NPDC002896]|uniref:MarR family winged helix-turn-helix transcriptional regulator n=1 Tax=Streptomyces sp. NPDC002896 TaxID=3154438 RepID=UPI00332520A9
MYKEADDEGGSGMDARWAELADLALIIAREIQFRGYTDERAIVLTPSEGAVVRHLHIDPAATPTRIAAATGLRRNNLSNTLRGLEAKGLIERRITPDDRRGVTVHMTERGEANYLLVRQEWAGAVSTAAGGDTRELETTLTLLRTVKTGLVAARSGTPAPKPVP